MTVQQEVQQQIGRCVAGIPWILEVTTGQITPEADNISNDELIHGLTILTGELVRIVDRLAGEIDQLRAAE
jgi:hypothetical protein